ncbi:MAG: hypothetical protein LC633_08920, partial [Desulfobulbaceae bacterium]|nr:hypothetical protein [Desulfobulbaceae bacterium]
ALNTSTSMVLSAFWVNLLESEVLASQYRAKVLDYLDICYVINKIFFTIFLWCKTRGDLPLVVLPEILSRWPMDSKIRVKYDQRTGPRCPPQDRQEIRPC